MKKLIVAAVAAVSLSGGALAVAALAPIAIASAQDSALQQETSDATAKAEPKSKPQRRAAVRARVKARAGTRTGALAEHLGMTPEALKQELRSGKSLAEIAGPKTQELVAALTAKANARIDSALAAGKIDEARATAMREKVGPFIERLVNAKRHVGSPARPN